MGPRPVLLVGNGHQGNEGSWVERPTSELGLDTAQTPTGSSSGESCTMGGHDAATPRARMKAFGL